jgi:hypothetical protein
MSLYEVSPLLYSSALILLPVSVSEWVTNLCMELLSQLKSTFQPNNIQLFKCASGELGFFFPNTHNSVRWPHS